MKMSNMVEHARRELTLVGEDPDVIEWYCRVIEEYASFGHSGGSMEATLPVLEKLLRLKNLTPITDNPDEWTFHDEEKWGDPGGIWQNKRNSQAFSKDGGKTYTVLSERGARDLMPLHTSVLSKKE